MKPRCMLLFILLVLYCTCKRDTTAVCSYNFNTDGDQGTVFGFLPTLKTKYYLIVYGCRQLRMTAGQNACCSRT